MTKQDYLLVCLSEECGEVTRAIGKALRFGLDDHNPHTGVSAEEHLNAEINDLYTLILQLQEDGFIKPFDQKAVDTKKAKGLKYYEYAKMKGRVCE